MAQQQIITVTDDLDGSEPAQPVRFTLDGTAYEIDLGEANRKALEDVVASYAAHARPVSARKGGTPRDRSAEGRRQTARVREWAAGQGVVLKERGRIPAEVTAAYRAGHGLA